MTVARILDGEKFRVFGMNESFVFFFLGGKLCSVLKNIGKRGGEMEGYQFSDEESSRAFACLQKCFTNELFNSFSPST